MMTFREWLARRVDAVGMLRARLLARTVLTAIAVLTAGTMVLGTQDVVADEIQPPTAEEQIDFSRHIAPLLRTYCVGCHNADDADGGLVLESYEQLAAGGDSGAVLVAGDSAASRLIQVLSGAAEPQMPPEGSERPSDEQLALLRAWIDQGATGSSLAPHEAATLITPRIDLLAPAREPIRAADWSADGSLLALAGDGRVRLIHAAGRGVHNTLEDHSGVVNDVRFSSDGKWLVTAGGETGLFGEAVVWDVASGSRVVAVRGHRDSIYAAALNAEATVLATASYDQSIELWALPSGDRLRTIAGHNGAVFDLAFSPDGRWLASASADRTVKLWDVASGERLDTFGQALKELYQVAFSPDGKRLVAGGVDNRIRVWQLSSTGREGTSPLVESRFAHEGPIVGLAFSRDGKLLASSAEDGTVKLWVAAELRELRLLPAQPDWPTALAFSPDGKQLLVGRLDGEFEIYDAASGRPVPPSRPELAAIEPPAVMRGTTARVVLRGKHLATASSLALGESTIEASLASINGPGDEIVAELAVPGDLSRGTYEVAVVTPGGTSGKLKLYVDDLPQHVESEPNNRPEQATALDLPAGVWGTLDARGDVDWFAFDAAAGQTLVLELSAAAVGSKLNGVLTVRDPSGRLVASSNDFDGHADPLIAHTVEVAGRYTVRVSDLMQNGSAEHRYRLSVGSFPYVTGVFPLSVPADTESTVELTGYNLPDDAHVVVAAGKQGSVPVPVDPQRYRSRGSYQVLVGDLPEVLEVEPNDEPATATPIDVPCVVGGRIAAADGQGGTDIDYFRFDARAGETWIVETDAARRGSPIDTYVEVLTAEGQPIPRLLLQATRDSAITFRSINSEVNDVRVLNWEEMELNQLLYMQGEVVRIFRMPRGPDSGFTFYAWGGKRIAWFDTTGTAHATDEPCYIVEPYPPGTELVPNGLPVYTLTYANDDDGWRKRGRDSQLTFRAPADGSYVVRVGDVRGTGGDRFAYRLIVRRPQPDFHVSVGGRDQTVTAGGGKNLTFTVDRVDGFEGPVAIEVRGLPEGFHLSSPLVVEPGHFQADAVLYADLAAERPPEEAWSEVQVTATAQIDGSPVTKAVANVGVVKLAPQGKLRVRLEPAEVTLVPGGVVEAWLKIERDGFDDRVLFEVNNLPHGVIVDNIGLNGVLIPEGQTERQIFLAARDWVPETSRPAHAIATNAGGESSPPLIVHIRKAAGVAQASPADQAAVAPAEGAAAGDPAASGDPAAAGAVSTGAVSTDAASTTGAAP